MQRIFITSQLRYLFVQYSYVFHDVGITLYFGTFKSCTEITFQNGHFLVTFVCNQKMTKKYVIIKEFVSWVCSSK